MNFTQNTLLCLNYDQLYFFLQLQNIPLFNDFFWSSSINFKAERLWILRLIYAGLNLDDDAQIYIRNSILESLMSFYVFPLSDNETRELILQVILSFNMISLFLCYCFRAIVYAY